MLPVPVVCYACVVNPQLTLVAYSDGNVWYHDNDTGQRKHLSDCLGTGPHRRDIVTDGYYNRKPYVPAWLWTTDPRLRVSEGL